MKAAIDSGGSASPMFHVPTQTVSGNSSCPYEQAQEDVQRFYKTGKKKNTAKEVVDGKH